jgi:hypothetical protein
LETVQDYHLSTELSGRYKFKRRLKMQGLNIRSRIMALRDPKTSRHQVRKGKADLTSKLNWPLDFLLNGAI